MIDCLIICSSLSPLLCFQLIQYSRLHAQTRRAKWSRPTLRTKQLPKRFGQGPFAALRVCSVGHADTCARLQALVTKTLEAKAERISVKEVTQVFQVDPLFRKVGPIAPCMHISWVHGRMDGQQIDGRMDGQIDGRMDGQIDGCSGR